MSATPSAEIHAAVEATRAAGTAKTRRTSRADGATGTPSLAEEGVADLAGGRACLASHRDHVWQDDLHYQCFDGEWTAEPLLDDPTAHPVFPSLAGTPEHRVWRTVELWRFGADAAMPQPPAGLRPPGAAGKLRRFAGDSKLVWHHRRELIDALREIRDGGNR